MENEEAWVGDAVVVRILEQVVSHYLEVHRSERGDGWSHHIPDFRTPVQCARSKGGMCVQGAPGYEKLCEAGAMYEFSSTCVSRGWSSPWRTIGLS